MSHENNGNRNGSGNIDPSTARKILAAQQKKRVDLCQRAIEKALQRHNCTIVPEITITGTQIQATIRILARPSHAPDVC